MKTEHLRLRGLRAAQVAIEDMIKEARSACEPYANRQGRTMQWWKGQLDGLICASAMLALADFPGSSSNAKQIEELLLPHDSPPTTPDDTRRQ